MESDAVKGWLDFLAKNSIIYRIEPIDIRGSKDLSGKKANDMFSDKKARLTNST